MDTLSDLREELYTMMNEATDEIARRAPEACAAMPGTETWKEYRQAENIAGDTRDPRVLKLQLLRMRQLLDQINTL